MYSKRSTNHEIRNMSLTDKMNIQGVSEEIENILGNGSMDFSE